MLALITACGSEEPATSPETDRAALISLYHFTDGPNWIRSSNWMTDEPLRLWAGVTTDAEGRVVALELFQNNLAGFIPTALGNLDKLVVLDIANTHERESSRETDPNIGDVIGAFADAFVAIFSERPPEYNALVGCVPRRLKGQLNTDKSFLGGLPFCDKADEARMNRWALERAIESENVAEVRRLLSDESIDKEASFEGGDWPELAVRQDATEILQALLDAGIHPSCANEPDLTLLHEAVANENADMVRLLAEVCSQDLNALRGREQALYELLSSEELNDLRERGILREQTPLSLAIESGNGDVVRVLVEAGADPNFRVSPEYEVGSHLAYAVDLGEVEIVKLLLEAGADPNVADAEGTPLQRAFDNDDASLVSILADAGADVGGDGRQMLFGEVRSGDADMVAALVEAGVDVNATDGSGRSMLYWAILTDNPDIAGLLVDAGADVNATDAEGETMLHWAKVTNNPEIVALLVDAGAQE